MSSCVTKFKPCFRSRFFHLCLLFSLFSLVMYTGASEAQVREDLPRVLYRSPSEVIDGGLLDRGDAALEEGRNEDLSGMKDELEENLIRYDGQFLDGKRTYYERRINPIVSGELDSDAIRRFTVNLNRVPGESRYIGDDPYLFRLHRLLGAIYEESNRPRDAQRQYQEALRYTRLELPVPPTVPENQTAESESNNMAESRLMRMAISFGDPERLRQEENPGLKSAGERIAEMAVQYAQLSRMADEARKSIYVAEANLAAGRGGDPAPARAESERLQDQLNQLKTEINNTFEGSYLDYLRRERSREADVMFRIARLVKAKEEKLREKGRFAAGNSYYRGKGDARGFLRTDAGKNAAYRIWLEAARKIEPENGEYARLLAEEYADSGDYERALDEERAYILTAKNNGADPWQLAPHYFFLGGLYVQLRDYINGAGAYETYLSIDQNGNAESAAQAGLYLADIHFNHTGRLQRAKSLYEEWLNRSFDRPDAPLKERTELRAIRFRVLKNMASISRQMQRTAMETEYLNRARQVYAAVRSDRSAVETEAARIKLRLNELKKDLRFREDEQMQREYFRLLRMELPAAERDIAFLNARLSVLDGPAILERLALLAQRNRDFQGALDLYREILDMGRKDQATRARKNIDRIQQTLADGFLRSPALPARHER